MYIAKPYTEDDRYFGVYLKTDCEQYNLGYDHGDNLVVLCFSLRNAQKIADILNIDHEFEEAVMKYD